MEFGGSVSCPGRCATRRKEPAVRMVGRSQSWSGRFGEEGFRTVVGDSNPGSCSPYLIIVPARMCVVQTGP
jgi:hypothetical protein